MHEIYDVITKQTIIIRNGRRKQDAIAAGIPAHSLSRLLNGKHEQVSGRFILPQNKSKIFTLIDIDTEIEYDCITNKSIFLYFDLPVIENEIKYIYELFRKRQKIASICNRVFYLKGQKPTERSSKSKNKSEVISANKEKCEKRYKIYQRLLRRIYDGVRRKIAYKMGHTEELIGCRIEFFIGYIENLFTKGMSWDNYGEWHFDHIKPCISFDLDSIESQKECFNYLNIRPLWATNDIARKYGESEDYIGNLNRKKY